MIEDELLKLRFKLGGEDALRRMYEKYLDYLLGVAMAFLNDSHAAQDVVHDVFVSLAQSADTFRLTGNLKHYLATCVANRAKDRLRAVKRRREHSSPEGVEPQNPAGYPPCDSRLPAGQHRFHKAEFVDSAFFMRGSLAQRVEVSHGSQVDPVVGDRRRGVNLLAEVVPAQDLQLVGDLNDRDNAGG